MANVYAGIIGASDKAAEGYFRNMANADAREQNAFNRRRIEQSDAYAAQDRNYLMKQRQVERMKAAAEEAMNYYAGAEGNPDRDAEVQRFMTEAALDIGINPNQDFLSGIKGRMSLLYQDKDNTPSNVRTYEYYKGLPEEEKPSFMETLRAGNRFEGGGGSQFYRTPDGRIQELVAPEVATARDAERAGAIEGEKIAAEGASPQGQAELEKQRLENEKALQEAAEARKKGELAERAKNEISALVTEISKMDLSPVYGSIQGSRWMPSIRQGTVDAESAIRRLGNMLTLDNLGKMSGVLTDRDIEILANAASELQNFRIGDERANREVERIARILGIQLDGGQGPSRPQETYEERRARILGQ